jgi:hypothetical protein
MTFRQNVFLQNWFRNKLGVELGYRVRLGFRVRVRVGVWNRVSVSKIRRTREQLAELTASSGS